jgi:hypothetical protein
MLCLLCSDLDLDALLSDNGLFHHVSRKALSSSAQQGCELCKTIISHLAEISSQSKSKDIKHKLKHLFQARRESSQTQIVCRVSNPYFALPHAFSTIHFSQPWLDPGFEFDAKVSFQCETFEGMLYYHLKANNLD